MSLERQLEQETNLVRADLDRILSDLPNGFATFDRQWRYTYVNDRLLQIFNLSRAEVLGKPAWEVFPHRVGIEFFDLLNRAMIDRVEAQFEFYYELVECWVEHRVYPTADGVAIVMTDISDRKRTEFALRESAEKFRAFINTAANVIYEMSADWREMLFLEGKGFVATTEDSRRDWLKAYIPETEKPRVMAAIKRAIATRSNFELEHRVVLLDGTVGWTLSRAIPLIDEAGEIVKWFGAATDITARKQAEAALRESEENYRSLFNSIDEGFCIVEVIFDPAQRPTDYRFLQINPAFSRLTGLSADAVGKTALELVPDLEPFWVETYGNVALTGESVRFENEAVAMERWYNVYASRIGDASSRRVAIVFDNITERKQAEQISRLAAKFDAFRIALTDALRNIVDPIEIQATTSCVLGEYLGANRVLYFEMCGDDYVVERDYINGVISLVGNHAIDSFGSELVAAHQAGRSISVADVATASHLSPAERAAFADVQIGAHIDISLIRDGEFVAGLAVHSCAPRVWTADEVALVEEVAERTWAAIERARAEAALQRLAILAESSQEFFGMCDLEFVPFYVNAAALRMVGLNSVDEVRAVSVRDFFYPEDWEKLEGEFFPRVLREGGSEVEIRFRHFQTGEPIWVIYSVVTLTDDRGQKIGFGTVCRDITDRKRQTANLSILAEITGELAGLIDIDTTMNRLGETIGRHFGAAQCVFGEFAADRETVTSGHGWHVDGALSLFGTYRMEDFIADEGIWTGVPLVVNDTQTDPRVNAANYAALGIGAFILVPLLRDGEWRFLLPLVDSKPRQWRDDEVDLLREIADRTWARLERARAEEAVAASLRDTQLLRELGARLVTEDDFQKLYQEILSTAIALTHADAGTVQILDETTQELVLLATQGFDRAMTDRFYRVDACSDTSCGSALRNGERTFVDFDVPESEDLHGSMQMHVAAGYLSAQSTPLIGRSGRAIGMVSTHWRERHRPSDSPKERLCKRELRFLDLLARQAADLIEQRQTATALHDRKEQLRLASDAAQVGMWFWNLETDSLTWTDQCKTLLGLPKQTEMSYELFLNTIHLDDRERTHTAVSQSIADRTEYDIEYRCCWSDGSLHWIAAKGSCSYDPTGTPVRMMGVAMDITALKQAQIDLADRNQELDSFVYIVSHDLKAPLRAISNLSTWIEEDLGTDLPTEIGQYMTQLRGRVRRMEAMIDGLLDYARLGRADVQTELVSVTELLEEILDSLAPPSTFEIAIAPDLPTFHTKRLLLSQVFANLISNAFKHHDKSDGFIRISCQEQGDFYEFTIVDDGPGIAQEQHERVFVIFHSAKSQKNPDSTGIGLSIVKKIVEAVGGKIRLESELGKGTTFYFTWPSRATDVK